MVFAATNAKSATRLYRAQNVIWVWLGLAAGLSAFAWLLRPSLGPALVTGSDLVDAVRNGLFCYGGLLIACGVWWIRRQLEIFGHVAFATGAMLTAIATLGQPGSQYVAVITTGGVALASGFRAFYLVRWIGATEATRYHSPSS